MIEKHTNQIQLKYSKKLQDQRLGYRPVHYIVMYEIVNMNLVLRCVFHKNSRYKEVER